MSSSCDYERNVSSWDSLLGKSMNIGSVDSYANMIRNKTNSKELMEIRL